MSAQNESAESNIPATLTRPQIRVLFALMRSETWTRRKSLERIAGTTQVLQIVFELRMKVTGHDGIELMGQYAKDRDGKPFSRILFRLTNIGRRRVREAFEYQSCDATNPRVNAKPGVQRKQLDQKEAADRKRLAVYEKLIAFLNAELAEIAAPGGEEP